MATSKQNARGVPSDALLFPRGSAEREAETQKFFASITSDPTILSPQLKAVLLPFLQGRVAPALGRAAAAQAGRPGASMQGIINNLATTGGFQLAQGLGGLQSAIESARLGIPSAPSIGTSAVEGGIEGFAASGSPYGALAGAVGGALKSRSARKAEGKAQGAAQTAAQEATPAAFAEEVARSEGTVREAALASGEGARRAQSIEAAITASGLRDTGLGTLASLAAGIQVPLDTASKTLNLALEQTTQDVERQIGALGRIRQQRDPVAMALEGLTTAFLAGGFKKKPTVSGTDLNPLADLGQLYPTPENPSGTIDTSVF
jgi:hypothetical protein